LSSAPFRDAWSPLTLLYAAIHGAGPRAFDGDLRRPQVGFAVRIGIDDRVQQCRLVSLQFSE